MRRLILSLPSPISFSQESFQFCQTSSLLLLDLFQSWIHPDRPACRVSDRSGALYSTIHADAICFWLVSAIRKLSVGNRLPCRTTETPFTTGSAFSRPLLPQLRPARFLSLRHLSPGRGGNLPVARRSYARLCSGIGPNEFPEDGDGLVQPVEFFLYAAAFSPELSQHPTKIGHPDLRFPLSNDFKKALYGIAAIEGPKLARLFENYGITPAQGD